MSTLEIVNIVISSGLGVGFITLVYSLGKKSQLFKTMKENQEKMDLKLDAINVTLLQISHRLSRMEGYLEGRDVHIKATGTEEKK